MAKSQYQSTEIMRVRFSPFVNATTGAYIIGTDTCTLNYRPPGGAPASVAMAWDSSIQMWYYDFLVAGYVQGEWRFRAVSSDAAALPQWKTIVWGDYVDDVTLGKTAAASADTKLGLPAVTVSDDIAAIDVKVGAPAVSLAADLAAVGGDVTSIEADVISLRKIATNRWKQDATLKQYLVYNDDGVTVLFRFNTFDDSGVPAGSRVFERRPVP
jgi:hypothetical protein